MDRDSGALPCGRAAGLCSALTPGCPPQLIVFCFIISALVVAGASWNGSFTFMAVWVLLLNLAMSVGCDSLTFAVSLHHH